MDPVENPVRAVSIMPGVRVDWLTNQGTSSVFRVICRGDIEEESGPAVNALGHVATDPVLDPT